MSRGVNVPDANKRTNGRETMAALKPPPANESQTEQQARWTGQLTYYRAPNPPNRSRWTPNRRPNATSASRVATAGGRQLVSSSSHLLTASWQVPIPAFLENRRGGSQTGHSDLIGIMYEMIPSHRQGELTPSCAGFNPDQCT